MTTQTIRRLSTVSKKAAGAKAASNDFVSQRAEYKKQMSELRKKWQEDFAEKARLEAERQAAERHRIVLERAVRLREHRKISQERQEQARKRREAALRLYQEKLAKTHLLWEEHEALQKKREDLAVQDLVEESSTWITKDNIETKITDALFEIPGATTGLSTVWREHWNFQTYVPSIRRMFTDVDARAKSSSLSERFADRSRDLEGDKLLMRRLYVEEFLNSSIESGEERAKFKDLVNEFSVSFQEYGAFDDLDDELEAGFDVAQNAANQVMNEGLQRNTKVIEESVEEEIDLMGELSEKK